MNPDQIRDGVKMVLEGLGIQADRDQNFLDTPDRVARAYQEIFSGLVDYHGQVREALSVSFPSTYDQMVIAKNITTFSMCPHHLLPVRYQISIGYLPDQGGDVVGISKLARVAEILSHRPVMQEQLTNDITDALTQALSHCLGAACVVSGEHHCMMMRGVRATGCTVLTSSVKGVFLSDASVREEFMSLIR